MEQVLRAYAEFWSESDAERREELLDSCWSEESEIVGPGYFFKGKKAVLAEAARFQALRDFQWDPLLSGRRSSLPQKKRMRVRKLSKLRNPRALALIV